MREEFVEDGVSTKDVSMTGRSTKCWDTWYFGISNVCPPRHSLRVLGLKDLVSP